MLIIYLMLIMMILLFFNLIYLLGPYLAILPYHHILAKEIALLHGASSYHLGVDIPAPEGTYLYAIDDGLVTFASWGAGGGYTIVIELSNHANMSVSYCHVSPIMFVERGEHVSKKEIIGTVGPRNVYGIQNNPYRDEHGNPTNGSTTGCHLHFAIKKNGTNVDPLSFYY